MYERNNSFVLDMFVSVSSLHVLYEITNNLVHDVSQYDGLSVTVRAY